MSAFFLSANDLQGLIGGPDAPLIFDVRRREAFEADERVVPTARWREPSQVEIWAGDVPRGAKVVVYCAHGEQLSQGAAAELRARGIDAAALEGGMDGWRAAGGLSILKQGWPGREETKPSRWVTRTRPKIDRIACPWLIRRFADPSAVLLFVAPDQVIAAARELDAIPYDVEGVDFTHEGEGCSFDTFLDRFGLDDPALRDLALIVRGADTGRPDLAPQAAGLLAFSLGLSALAGDNDHGAVAQGMIFYDALYAWRRRAAEETHGWPPKAVAA